MYKRKWTLQVVGVLFAALLTASAAAQEKPRLLLNKDSDSPPDPRGQVFLRPNLQQAVYFYVQNPGEDAKKFTVAIKTGDEGAEVAKADIMVDAGKVGRVVFPKPKPAVAPAPGAAEPAPMFTKLDGPPFKFQAVLLDGATVIEKKDVAVDVLLPSQYVEVRGIEYKIEQMGKVNMLKIQVAAKGKEEFPAPPACNVDLVLLAGRIPSLIETKDRDGSFRQVLTRPDQPGEVFARNLKFRDIPNKNGLIYLRVDDYDRAFIFESSFENQEGTVTPRRINDPSARFDKDVYYLQPGAKLAFKLEVDNVIRPNAVVEYALARDPEGNFTPDDLVEKNGARDQRVGFGPPTPDGGILFKVDVADWAPEIDTAGLFGERKLRVRVLVDKKPIAEKEAKLVIDASPPVKAEFAGLPATVARGAMFTLKAKGGDPQSGIAEVEFFYGEPLPDGKVPPTAKRTKAQPPAKPDGEWTADVAAPAAKGPQLISVRFINNVGLDRIETASVEVVEPGAMANAGGAATKITGQVTEGDRPQPKLKVVVRDPAGVEKYSGETDKDGKYSIADVKPGMYKVTCLKESSQTKGEKSVTVEAGKEHKVDLQLFR